MEHGSVIKMINTRAKNEIENELVTKKHLEYILRKEAITRNLVYLNMVDKDNIFDTFGFFAKSAGKNTGRPLKHLVISYAVKNKLSWIEYLNITKEITKFFAYDYQMVAAVHDNIENRPHAHILIDCFNIATEKKYSESIKELEQLKDFVDEILEQHKIPKLLRWKNKNILYKPVWSTKNQLKESVDKEDMIFIAEDKIVGDDFHDSDEYDEINNTFDNIDKIMNNSLSYQEEIQKFFIGKVKSKDSTKILEQYDLTRLMRD